MGLGKQVNKVSEGFREKFFQIHGIEFLAVCGNPAEILDSKVNDGLMEYQFTRNDLILKESPKEFGFVSQFSNYFGEMSYSL